MVQHDQWARYHGTIADVTGSIMFDKDDPSASSVTVKTSPRSINTMNSAREQELRGPGFMNEHANPDITFASTTVTETGDKTGTITGNLTMAGISVPLTLQVTFDGEGMSSWDRRERIGFSAGGVLNVNDFKLSAFVPLNIGPVISVEVEAVQRGG